MVWKTWLEVGGHDRRRSGPLLRRQFYTFEQPDRATFRWGHEPVLFHKRASRTTFVVCPWRSGLFQVPSQQAISRRPLYEPLTDFGHVLTFKGDQATLHTRISIHDGSDVG